MCFHKINNVYRWRVLSLAIVFTMIAGCGGSDKPIVAKVHGTVTLDQKPFTQPAIVSFMPKAGGKMATAILNNDGSFQLKTYADNDGAVTGMHQVSIQPLYKFVQDEAPNSKQEKSLIPDKYLSATSSGWKFEVKAGAVNECPLEMKSK
jgi:hypothetical protein